jgi:hypothetical protein
MAEEDNAPVARVQDVCLLFIQPYRIPGLVSEEAVVVHPSDGIGLMDFPIQRSF